MDLVPFNPNARRTEDVQPDEQGDGAKPTPKLKLKSLTLQIERFLNFCIFSRYEPFFLVYLHSEVSTYFSRLEEHSAPPFYYQLKIFGGDNDIIV